MALITAETLYPAVTLTGRYDVDVKALQELIDKLRQDNINLRAELVAIDARLTALE